MEPSTASPLPPSPLCAKEDEPLQPFCDGCGNVIEPDVCHCGDGPDSYEHHAELGGNHAFVPAGCTCLFMDTSWADVAKRLRARLREERQSTGAVRMRLACESCGKLHVDQGEFATKPHHTHQCAYCGLVWRPAIVNTVGVLFLYDQAK